MIQNHLHVMVLKKVSSISGNQTNPPHFGSQSHESLLFPHGVPCSSVVKKAVDPSDHPMST